MEKDKKEENSEEEITEPIKSKKKSDITNAFRANPFILSTIVCGILAIVLIVVMILGNAGVSANVVKNNFIDFADSQLDSLEVLNVERQDDLYAVTFTSSSTGESIVYVSLDGKYLISGRIPLETEEIEEPEKTILECSADYGLTEDTIIFYYSNSCGWCAKMKPGVEVLESLGYNIYWIEASGEDTEVIDECVKGYMTSGGVPQFICVRTGEIHVGAFADSESNLDQEEMNAWVEECLNG